MGTFGRYEILERVGAGGMAEVYLARAYGTDGFVKDLVLKKILDTHSGNMAFRKMFVEEAKITVGLTHTNIVQVFDFGKVDHTYFLAMERVNGIDLRALLKAAAEKKLRIPVPVALFIAAEMLKGLDFAHRRTDESGKPLGIVHRDVSPSNVLVSWEGEVKVADFGIAHISGGDSWQTPGQVIGKPRYMSPEQLRDDPIDARADVFACGVVLHELLSGAPPFRGKDDRETVQIVLAGDAKPPSFSASDLPKDLDPVVMKALDVDRKNRYASAAAFHDALQDYALDHRIRLGSAHLAEFLRKCVDAPQLTAPRAAAPASREVTILSRVATGEDMAQFTSGVDRAAMTEIGSASLPVAVGAPSVAKADPAAGVRTADLSTVPTGSPSRAGSRARWGMAAVAGVVVVAALGTTLGRNWLRAAPTGTATPGAAGTATGLVATTPTSSLALAVESPAATAEASPTPLPTHVAVVRPTNTRRRPPKTPPPTAAPTPTAAIVAIVPGTLDFNTLPTGRVLLDGKDTGRFTPLIGFEIAPGIHELVVEDPNSHAKAHLHLTVHPGEHIHHAGMHLK